MSSNMMRHVRYCVVFFPKIPLEFNFIKLQSNHFLKMGTLFTNSEHKFVQKNEIQDLKSQVSENMTNFYNRWRNV